MSHTWTHKPRAHHRTHDEMERDYRRLMRARKASDREDADAPRGITDNRPGDLQKARTA